MKLDKLDPMELKVMKCIQKSDGVSRKMLSEMADASQATITKVTKVLIDQQYVVEGEHIGSGMGRKEVLLYLNPQKFRYLGMDIGGHKVRLALADHGLSITHYTEYLTSELDPELDIMKLLIEKMELFLTESGVQSTDIDAVGIGVTGIVDEEMKRILNIPNLSQWGELDIINRLQNQFSCPIFLDESGRTMALIEKSMGKARHIGNFMVIHIGFGIVSGIVINDQLVRGADNVGGLLGHTTADEGGIRCFCGNYGCLENQANYPLIEGSYRLRDGTFPSIAEALLHNDKIAMDICIDVGKAIGIALSNIINLFNPRAIYVGGPVYELPIIFEETKRTILLRANRYATVKLQLEYNSFGDKQGIMGALELARNSFSLEG
ncbi:ROK family protein [Paenibacillus eucommiae]|uniref:N-acetylglucosamine repressor n=1 Tax=Paenibacillus eucommiae TaxID=1355755 RepID=A0ABS4IR83_9BACL|nr:ROK family protein [Paenibacillus eucommiae]MBP1990081.1 N-acetylglucosamine repressor [Paenibacillus eucommiae]